MFSVIRILAVCGTGIGTSAIMRGRLQEALDVQGVSYELDVVEVGSAADREADLIFTSDELANHFVNRRARTVTIQNFTSRSEVLQKVSAALSEMGMGMPLGAPRRLL